MRDGIVRPARILALTALIPGRGAAGEKTGSRLAVGRPVLIALGIFGTALLYGDGMITPATTVLGAVEGLEVETPFFKPYVVPITVVILIGVFAIQRFGTHRVGGLFGPIVIVWFVVNAALGISWIVRAPHVCAAFDPRHAMVFFQLNGWMGFAVLGSVFLVVSGGEALYADMGHFGRRPIRLAWFALVLPSLVLNYLGQGALLLANPAASHPLFDLAPSWALLPLIAIEHTSAHERGQVYVPRVNGALMVATLTMIITALLLYVVMTERWRWPKPVAMAVMAVFLLIDVALFGANALKVVQGGWLPLVVAIGLFTIMTTWRTGRQIVAERLASRAIPLSEFFALVDAMRPVRVAGTAVYMTAQGSGTPAALVHNLQYNKVLHERVVILNVVTVQQPHCPDDDRFAVESLSYGLYNVRLQYGFMEEPDVPRALLAAARGLGLQFDFQDVVYFLGRETLLVTSAKGMAIWREKLFVLMSRNAGRATAYFRLPLERVVELGVQVEM